MTELHIPEHPRLFDEWSRPDFRSVFGGLLRDATHVDIALRRIRLSAMDLDEEELTGLHRLRVLLAEVSASTLGAEAHGVLLEPRRGRTLRHLARLLDRRIVQVRAAPLGGWSPDFTVFRGRNGPHAVLLGLHWLERPFPHRGPALASLHGREGAALAARRFDESWSRAYDIRPAIQGILRRALEMAEAEGRTGPAETPKAQGHPAPEGSSPNSPRPA